MKKLYFLAVLTVLASCASTRPVPPLNLAEALQPVAAEYVTTYRHAHDEKTHTTEKGKAETEESVVRWHFFREQKRIDIDNVASYTGEAWLRDGKLILMRQFFHDDRKGVEYQNDDFTLLGMQPSWQRQALLVDPVELQQLRESGTEWRDGHPLRSYKGEIKGQSVEIDWRVDLNVPQRIARKKGDEQEITELQAVYPLAQSPWQYRKGDDYELINYADIGDMERDPFVIKVQSWLLGGDVHHH